MEQILARCLVSAMHGERERGAGGVVYMENEHMTYLFHHELNPVAFRERITDMVAEDAGRHLVLVHKVELNLHVSLLIRPAGPAQLH
jgi:hypothetical protein